ncbi:MAG TPA: hypothetical protein VFG73_01030 [Rhodanobacteraceae bacterium]|nr:hypothetical protein [Rhodanobacteraceae bacterium]
MSILHRVSQHARLVGPLLLALGLAACGSSQPASGPQSAASTAGAPAASVASAPMPAASAAPAAASTAAAAAPVPVGTCGPQTGPEADRIANTAKWTTASEQDNFGYDVYRGESKDGPFVKLTKQPIPGGGTTDETHHYKFVDDTIDPCKAYWYYVESIDTSGRHEKFTPTYKAPAKRRPASAAAGS